MQARVSSASGGGATRRPSDEGAVGHIGSMNQPGLAWVSRQMRRQAASAAAPESRPSRVLPVPPRFECRHGNATEGGMAEGLAAARYSYHSGGSGFQNSPRQPTGEHPPAAHASGYGSHLRRMDDRPGVDRFNMFDAQSNGQSGPMHGDRSCSHVGSELPLRVDTFGYMAPCWRIIESAQAYVDKDQLEYMRALILAQVWKPMSREQLLERAEGCLQEQDEIFAAFEKMFDLIAGAPPAPHYPAERPPHPRPQSTSYGGRRVPDTDAIHASLHRSPPSQLPPSRAVVDDGEDPYSLGHFNGQSGVPVILPCGCTGKWPPGGPATNPS